MRAFARVLEEPARAHDMEVAAFRWWSADPRCRDRLDP
jgi:hypothetical protein